MPDVCKVDASDGKRTHKPRPFFFLQSPSCILRMAITFKHVQVSLPTLNVSVPRPASEPIKFFYSGGDRGAGGREKRGREVYGRREKRGREAGFPRWREAGEKGENYATLRNISQSKKCKGAGAKKYRAGTGIKGYRKREV